MSFRAILIVSPTHSKPIVIYKRVFPLVEKQHKECMGVDYTTIPGNLMELVADEVENHQDGECFLTIKSPPVYSFLNGSITPVVAFKKGQFIYCCVVSELSMSTTLQVQQSGIVCACVALTNMATLIAANVSVESARQKVSLLSRYVMIGFPFGQPVELGVNTVLAMLATADGAPKTKSKAPVWRPVSNKCKQIIQFNIHETMRAVQFDSEMMADACEVYGTIYCKADLEESPEVSFVTQFPLHTNNLNHISYHFCVQLVDELTSTRESDQQHDGVSEWVSRKLRFCPPYENIALCHYKVSLADNEKPLQTYYQMKGNYEHIDLLVQIRSTINLRNHFEYFDVTIPFFNRGAITGFKFNSAPANVTVRSDKAALLWRIGTKMPGKTGEISLDVSVAFDSGDVVMCDDSLMGLNSYILVSFKSGDATYSGARIDEKSVELYPRKKIKVQSSSGFSCTNYRVWNSHGDVTDTSFAS